MVLALPYTLAGISLRLMLRMGYQAGRRHRKRERLKTRDKDRWSGGYSKAMLDINGMWRPQIWAHLSSSRKQKIRDVEMKCSNCKRGAWKCGRKQFKRFEKNARTLKQPSKSVSSGNVYSSAFPELLANIYRANVHRHACYAHVTARCRICVHEEWEKLLSVWVCIAPGWRSACTCEWLASVHTCYRVCEDSGKVGQPLAKVVRMRFAGTPVRALRGVAVETGSYISPDKALWKSITHPDRPVLLQPTLT